MRSEALRHRVHIQQYGAVTGPSGGTTKEWSTFADKVPASMRNPSGNERRVTSHGGEVAEARTEFRIRYLRNVDARMRILYDGRIFNIKHVNDVNEAHRWMILTCDTGANNG